MRSPDIGSAVLSVMVLTLLVTPVTYLLLNKLRGTVRWRRLAAGGQRLAGEFRTLLRWSRDGRVRAVEAATSYVLPEGAARDILKPGLAGPGGSL